MDVQSAGEADLARRIASTGATGDPEAEAELYGRLAPRVRLYGLRHLRDEQAAADLTQQVLLMTIERLREGKVREPERLPSFVLGMCRLVVLEFRRGHRRRAGLLERFAAESPAAALPAPPPLPAARLTACLERLSERERSVLILTFQAERSADEVAQELGLAASHVRVIRHRALGRLRHCMSSGETAP